MCRTKTLINRTRPGQEAQRPDFGRGAKAIVIGGMALALSERTAGSMVIDKCGETKVRVGTKVCEA